MNRRLACAGFLLLTFLAACVSPRARPDYETTRQRAEEAHRNLSNEKGPQPTP